MDTSKVNMFFVAEKIFKVRWVPEQLKETQRFLTGSWDMSTNFIRIWNLNQNEYDSNKYTPKCSDKIQFDGDITGLEFIDDDLVAASSSHGRIMLFKVKRAIEADTLEKVALSPVLHKFNVAEKPAPCTAISVFSKDIATVGEDGRLNIYNVTAPNQIHRTIEADSCALTAVAYVNPQEVLTANRMGIIRVFDVRATATETNTGLFEIPSKDEKVANAVTYLTSHPTQAHVVFAGSEEGSISVWDLRQPGFPASYLSAHTSPITEIGFHRAQPSAFFSAAEDGDLWMWTQQQSTMDVPNTKSSTQPSTENTNPWLSGERTKNLVSLKSLVTSTGKSINSFSAHGSKVICGSDSEAVYMFDTMS